MEIFIVYLLRYENESILGIHVGIIVDQNLDRKCRSKGKQY